MKTLIRTLLLLSLIVWLGAEIFFPVVAAVSFGQLAPDTHAAGLIVGSLLRIIHGVGLVCGVVLLALVGLAPAWGIFRPRTVMSLLSLLVVMLGLTAYSQFGIIPAMEQDRQQAPGAVISSLPSDSPPRRDFETLHNRSTKVEGLILLLGIVVVALVSSAEPRQAQHL